LAQPAISLHDVHLRLGSGRAQVHVLRGINLDIETGDSVAVLGPSGSGKSSLLMVMAGLERAGSGHVAVAGSDLAAMSEDQLAQFRGIHAGIVFQSFHLIATMTALENVAVPLELAQADGRRGGDDIWVQAQTELESVNLGNRAAHYPAELSGGEQQRVALARALAPRPDILFADEPTGNLDGATGRQIIELLFSAHETRGTTLVLVTHDEALASRLPCANCAAASPASWCLSPALRWVSVPSPPSAR
jgi:putative ABC transport system ATP-binding protein